MLDRMVCYIVEHLMKKNIVKEKERPVYEYGIRNAMMIAMNWIVVVLFGVWYSCLKQMVLFGFCYSVLRSYAGGLHLSTHRKCFWLSLFLYQCSVWLLVCRITFVYYGIVLLAGVGGIWMLAPVENRNKPLDKIERKIYGRRAKWISVFLGMLGLLLYCFSCYSYANAVAWSVFLSALLCMIGRIIEKAKIYP